LVELVWMTGAAYLARTHAVTGTWSIAGSTA